MIIFFAFLIKLTTIFLCGGVVSLLAMWVATETCSAVRGLLNSGTAKVQKDKLALAKNQKVSAQTGLYEIFVPGNKTVKVFSTHKGIRIV